VPSQKEARKEVISAYRITLTLPTNDEPSLLTAPARSIYLPKDRGRKRMLEDLDFSYLLKNEEFNWEGAFIESVEGPFFEEM
jgi:hypothetical protein